MKLLPSEDLRHVLQHAGSALSELRNSRLFITGGTGFFGKWLLETFAYANRELSLNAKAVVLSRNPGKFLAEMPHLAAESCLEFIHGDVTNFAFPPGEFQWIIHAATESSTDLNARDPLAMLDTTIDGTRRVLDLAAGGGGGACRGFLLTSSGAVYGPQPPGLTHIPETYTGAPDSMDPKAAYANGKRLAEHLCCLYHEKHNVPAKIARCFAFVGPHLPLDKHFAIGNFISAALRGEPLLIQGDGTPLRSYLHAADLALWLWTLLLKGHSGTAYNVGGDEAVSIAALAQRVCAVLGSSSRVEIAKNPVPGAPVQRYLPDLGRIVQQFGLQPHITLDQAILRTAEWAAHWHQLRPTREHNPC